MEMKKQMTVKWQMNVQPIFGESCIKIIVLNFKSLDNFVIAFVLALLNFPSYLREEFKFKSYAFI
jgi:hypothetical protein